ncbi:hypothetical protein T05_166 [Trichinella murrelli]|uniref:Uncharacterized protein n=1 Tax=Trichinella murrelli TaxID=144512 RepID=A0A0V0UBP0_9BILA|nr:hypothetical protein T05_166 [Trichinella murrelli]
MRKQRTFTLDFKTKSIPHYYLPTQPYLLLYVIKIKSSSLDEKKKQLLVIVTGRVDIFYS